MARILKYGGYDHKRFHAEKSKPGDLRSEFQRDRDRIIHSFAFRRLQGKTQVIAIGEADFFRTRLTHSLEVSQIGRALSSRLGANPDLVEAICLAHDLGHPPFGHKGETILNELMNEYEGFGANAQTFRILTEIEGRTPAYRGLNLTRATLDGLLKYKNKHRDLTTNDRITHFFYDEDDQLVQWVDKNWKQGSQSLECSIMEWADDVAYAVHDFEDAVRSGFIRYENFVDAGLLDEISKHLDASDDSLDREEVGFIVNQMAQELWKRRKHKIGSRELKEFTSSLIHQMITAARLKSIATNAWSVRYRWAISVDPIAKKKCLILQRIVRTLYIENPRIANLEFKAEVVLRHLFDVLMDPRYINLVPEEFQFHLKKMKNNRKKYARLICDYISGMTDHYAIRLYLRLFDPRHGLSEFQFS